MDDDLGRFCCQNRRCVAYGSRGAGNLTMNRFFNLDRIHPRPRGIIECFLA